LHVLVANAGELFVVVVVVVFFVDVLFADVDFVELVLVDFVDVDFVVVDFVAVVAALVAAVVVEVVVDLFEVTSVEAAAFAVEVNGALFAPEARVEAAATFAQLEGVCIVY